VPANEGVVGLDLERRRGEGRSKATLRRMTYKGSGKRVWIEGRAFERITERCPGFLDACVPSENRDPRYHHAENL